MYTMMSNIYLKLKDEVVSGKQEWPKLIITKKENQANQYLYPYI